MRPSRHDDASGRSAGRRDPSSARTRPGRAPPPVGGLTTMWKLIKRWWKYLVAVGNRHHEQTADPAVQLEQAVRAAQEEDRRLREQAAMVIANQRQAQRRLDEAMTNYEKAEASASHALVLAD